MTSNYIKNLVGIHLTEDQMQDITQPGLELFTHLFFKSIQSGVILGAMVIAPVFLAVQGPRTFWAIKNSAISFGKAGTVIGAGVGVPFAYQITHSKDEDGRMDRAYRLRKNQNQVRVDRSWILGSALGMVAASPLGMSMTTGLVCGEVSALVGALIWNITLGKPHMG